ncbi:MAG: hypothetical protein HFH14_11095 [Lachnospiraceae bacterium]|nr:hypothetical protein [Lachnospiraceae bacterium]
MNDRMKEAFKMKEAFNQIHAENALKNSTKEFLAKKTKGYTKSIRRRTHIYAVACACMIFLIICGRWLYFTPVSAISIDINPSFEISVNRFGRVIAVDSMNDDDEELANTLNIKYKYYEDAINQILDDKNILDLLSGNEIMTITVTGPDETKSAEIYSEIRWCTRGRENTYCYSSSSEEVSSAHEAGLSYGKYRAFLELQVLDPDITPEIIRGMTMREIRDLISSLSDEGDCGTSDNIPDCEMSTDDNKGYGHHGDGNGNGCGRGNRHGSE